MRYYKDLREHIQALRENGKLVEIGSEVNKDTELMPLVRWQFRGLGERERKAFLFEHVADVKGKKYNGSVLVGSHAVSREVYALAMRCKPEEINKKWEEAQLYPIKPRIIESGPVHEEIHIGNTLLEHGGIEEFPVPISTPGVDNAPYFSAGNFVSKDPGTGIRNVGTYRAMVKSPTRTGIHAVMPQHLRQHWEKYRRKGVPMPAAVFIGPTPNIGLVSVVKIPYGVDEYDVAGGIAGEPVELVKCKTVDIEVPSTAEIIFEGEIPTDYLEREGPFGEYTGYMGMGRQAMVFNISCITHRKRPIWNAFISQFPPSESSVLRGVATEAICYKLLKHDLGIDSLVEVAFHNESGSWQFCAISLKRCETAQVWKALYGIVALEPAYGKMIIAVDDDIDPRDLDSIVWALCYRMQPNRDVQIVKGRAAALDLSVIPGEDLAEKVGRPLTSSLLIDATMKWDYPPTALPKREFMERAKELWEREGLPALKPKVPWFGHSLGFWREEDEEEAHLALKGEHYKTGEKLSRQKIKV
jgi:UbiD family decarboxylase